MKYYFSKSWRYVQDSFFLIIKIDLQDILYDEHKTCLNLFVPLTVFYFVLFFEKKVDIGYGS